MEIQSAVRRWLCGRVWRPHWRGGCEVMAAEKMRKEREKKAWLARMEAEEKERLARLATLRAPHRDLIAVIEVMV